ncbi:Na+/proline symporter [Desulfocurvibacter africanus PCS]|uniref:Na+/proline symporter n=1 Tax=Desulfocurvibacter africanus PCS TaxID=1262666 RepID=M5Q298_DESAF|nr:sodium:solute symporter family protein [Desulfocurvibacter africanus]EMG37238.1 Na+/proline symporter [Desulfocurvibacter africanus PCS]
MTVKLVIALIYLGVVFYLGYVGWKHTREAADYMLAGRRMNPFIMAMSYGATFISTSAIVGFGGVASLFGFPLLWLTFANIFVGIFIAMVFFGRRTRRMGVALDSHTFPELLGRRFKSRFIQGFAGLVIFLFIPVYAAAVLIGISRMIEVSLGIPYAAALIGFTLILAVYVVTGGMKAVMYTDAFQGGIMVVMMLILVAHTYSLLGGVIPAHQALTDMAALMPEKLRAGGLEGWTQGTRFGTPLWLTIYTTIVFGVGVGVLAQPQLAVRYMTVSSDRQLNRAVLYGGVFILLMTGVAFVVGALSNVIFHQTTGKLAIAVAGGNVDVVIPTYIETIMPAWFSTLFLMAMLAAAMSTLSSQYHAGGTSLGRDLLEKGLGLGKQESIKGTQWGVVVTIAMGLVWALFLPESVIAKATAFFFGLCAATFLPVYFLGLYWKRMSRTAAIASMLGGFGFSMFWLLFVHEAEAKVIGLCQILFGKATLVADATKGSWVFLLQWLDPNIVALPFSLLLAVLVALVTRHDAEHAEYCWRNY